MYETSKMISDMMQGQDEPQKDNTIKATDPNPKIHLDYIDFLKVIGLLGIFIAHVNSPGWIMMLRSFDVPLMVIISALLCQKSYERNRLKGVSVWSFLFSRFKRLIIPTWIFLVFYFLLRFLYSGEPYSLRYYIASFTLTRYGISYIWIILIFSYSAIWIPILDRLSKRAYLPLSLLLLYVLYEICYHCGLGVDIPLIDTTFYYFVPYGCLTFLGVRYFRYNDRQKQLILLSAFLIFCAIFMYYWHMTGSPQPVSIAKYPPRIYYLSYGIFVSYALLLLSEKIRLHIYSNPIVVFVSRHSMWIYLWHILMLDIYDKICLPNVWWIKFIVVFIGSCTVVFIINAVLDIIQNDTLAPYIKYLRG